MGPEHFTPTVRHGVWLYILAPACRRVTRSWLPGSAPGPPPRTREASGLAQPTRPVNTKAHHQRRVIVMLDPRSHAIAFDALGGEHRGESQQEAAEQHELRRVRDRPRREAAEARRLQVQAERHEDPRSEEHTSELQSHSDLVCRLLLEKKKKNK